MKSVAVIGGGASGLIASFFSAKAGASVVLFEKQEKLGKKILITGNGRCNISNRVIKFSDYNGHNPEFVENIFDKFNQKDTEDFFTSIGIPFVEKENGKLFPFSLQASIVPKIFLYELKKIDVKIEFNKKILFIIKNKDNFKLTDSDGQESFFDSVIIAAGSCAYPELGGSQIGYDLAKSLGHRVYSPFPSILPINITDKIFYKLQGIRINCSIRIMLHHEEIGESKGELLFTKYGISGPVVLDISRVVNESVTKRESPEIVVDFFPDIDVENLLEKFENLWKDSGKKLSFSLLSLLKEKIPEVILNNIGIDYNRRVGDLSEKEKRYIVESFKNIMMKPGKIRSFSDAVVAAGGVSTDEVDPETMESKIIKGLYFTGELLDIDGRSGGFNLQFAWSTGAVAGISQ